MTKTFKLVIEDPFGEEEDFDFFSFKNTLSDALKLNGVNLVKLEVE